MKGTVWLLGLFLFCLPLRALAATHEVGPGKTYANIGDVPWESMNAGDQVSIFWRQEPYREKWVIAVQGTEQQPFIVRGMPNETGQLPVIDGRDATTRGAINYWNEDRGIVKIGGANKPSVLEPSWIVLENLNIRSGRPPYSFTGRYGSTGYLDNAASVYVESGRNIIIRGCILHDSGNGLFVSSSTRNILIESCRIHDNGMENSAYQHNTYTSALGIVYQFNTLGPLRANCSGNNLKDRSAGLVVRYNWIESGNRQLDLVDANGSPEITGDPSYRKTLVYGNILVEPAEPGNSQIVHYGGDSDVQDAYRKGTLHFYNNSIISTREGNTTLFRLSTNSETCDCRNNIVWTTASGEHLALLNSAGVVYLRNNWLKSGWADSHSGLTGAIHDNGGNLTGTHPGFVDAGTRNFHLRGVSPCVDAGAPPHTDALPLTQQYSENRQSETRPVDGHLDMGAFELPKGWLAPTLLLLTQ